MCVEQSMKLPELRLAGHYTPFTVAQSYTHPGEQRWGL